MKDSRFREFLQQTAVKTGAIAAACALVLTSSVWSGVLKGKEPAAITEASLPIFIDLEGAVDIDGDGIPGPAAPKVTKTTKTNKSTKKVKLKAKSTKTYTKKSTPKTQTKTTKKVTSKETTTITTETTTSLTSKFTKGSNINTQTTTVKTVTTTVVQAAASADEEIMVVSGAVGASEAPAQAQASGTVSLGAIAPRLNSRVANAYTSLGFTVEINPSVNYSGVFDARSRGITLKKSGDTVYHELGHFVAFIAGNVDKSSSFTQVFAQEKDKYTLYNKAYVCQNSSEYFAESFKNYTLDPNTLRATRPMTYSAIEAALNSITDEQVARAKAVYGAIWGA